MRHIASLLSKWLLPILLITSWSNARAEYVPPVGYTFGVILPGATTQTIFSTAQEAAAAYIAGYNAYYANSPAGPISATLLNVYSSCPAGSTICSTWYFDWHFSSPMSNDDYIGQQLASHIICPAGYSSNPGGVASSMCWRPDPPLPSAVSLTLSHGNPIIPQSSTVANGKVLTQVDVTATLLDRNVPAAGKTVTLASNRPALDSLVPGATFTTDAAGKALAKVRTRSQPGPTVLSGTTSGLTTPATTSVTWLPAKYEKQFLVTCYTIANESENAEKPASSGVCGLPEKQSYRDAFLKDVKMQGSGVALDGTTVHYAGRGCYNTDQCARTATGACATVGETIAVDLNIIPKRSAVNVQIIGSRKAQDTGGRIVGYHIDEYLGPQPKLCRQLGRRTSDVSLEKY